MCKCKICNNDANNTLYIGTEMMFGLREEFSYFKCSKCDCLQIETIPGNMNKYYPENYYSYSMKSSSKALKSKIADYLLNKAISTRIGHFNFFGQLAMLYNSYYKNEYFYLNKTTCNYETKILDIGCGSGALLNRMSCMGFRSLTGIDPYLKSDIHSLNGVNILKKSIYEIQGKYDFIMMHHSFEHMPEPHDVFFHLNRLLSEGGTLLIRIPLIDGYAWRKYGMKWFQIDAPRHFFLHTINSMTMLAETIGFKIDKVIYDSQASQILSSEKYLRNIPLLDVCDFTSEQIQVATKKSIELNSIMDGDQACLFLKKNNGCKL